MAVPVNFQSGVDKLRGLGGAVTTDVFDGNTYWTDDQLYALMLTKTEYRLSIPLKPVNQACTVFQFILPQHYYIDIDTVEMLGTDEVPTVDPEKRTMTFSTEITSTISFGAAIYNLWECAAQLWDEKAAQRYNAIRMKSGANQMYLEQEYEHCVQRAKYYRHRTMRKFRLKKGW